MNDTLKADPQIQLAAFRQEEEEKQKRANFLRYLYSVLSKTSAVLGTGLLISLIVAPFLAAIPFVGLAVMGAAVLVCVISAVIFGVKSKERSEEVETIRDRIETLETEMDTLDAKKRDTKSSVRPTHVSTPASSPQYTSEENTPLIPAATTGVVENSSTSTHRSHSNPPS
ncbi:MAG: hypothetical protein HY939_05015 [Gammaproteobacteria bacterium]|nr:hypothetical protein [Gammaproteobacteria bacterium]